MRLIALLFCLALTACAAPSAYRAAEGGGYGYSEIALGEGRWRVEYRGAQGQGLDEVESGLLLRAAELTLEAGFSRFAMIERGVEQEQALVENRPRWGVGLGVGRGWSGAQVGVGLPITVAPARRTAYAEIRALPEGAQTAAEVYDAAALIAALRPRLVKSQA